MSRLFEEIRSELGVVPNSVRTMARSPVVLEAYMAFRRALAAGRLKPRLRIQVGLAVAEANRCEHCRAAHAAVGRAGGLSEEVIRDSRLAVSPERSTEAALRFARALVERRGKVGDAEIDRLRRTGYGDAEIAELLATVVLNVFTNYFNQVADTDLDFPHAGRLEEQP